VQTIRLGEEPAQMLKSINPATGEQIAEFAVATAASIEAALQGAQRAQRTWARSSSSDRRALLHSVARRLRIEIDHP